MENRNTKFPLVQTNKAWLKYLIYTYLHEDEVRAQDMTFSVCAVLYGEGSLIKLGLTNQWLFSSKKGLTRPIMHGMYLGTGMIVEVIFTKFIYKFDLI